MEEHSDHCPTKVIEDIPAEKDELVPAGEIGPHARVATAIAEIIESKSEPGGKMIGLEGEWGSGKSTVIRLLRKKLDLNANISLFYLDAWAHEGDPLRRTYLESLIQHFQKSNWIDNSPWKNTIEELAQRRKVTKTKTFPETTLLAKLFAISLLFIPIGSLFVTSALDKGAVIEFGGSPSWRFIFGFLLVVSPFIVLMFNPIIFWIRKKFDKKFKEQFSWTFVVGNSITETIHESIETPDPTSIEFEEIFGRLMAEALGKNIERKAVIVLDNLDRVDSKFALSIWSTLQTFLQDRSSKNENWYQQVWILIPYDPKGLRQLWKNTVDQNEVAADSFIDKSFQLRFEVPALVLSNWRTHLLSLLKQAFPKHSEEEFVSMYKVFNLGRLNQGISPTPRELKLFVNNIGVIHRQWQDIFPLNTVAYFVLLKRQKIDVIDWLRTKTIDDAISGLLGSNLKRDLAGLAFNVKSEDGQQLLLRDPIFEALSKKEGNKIKELVERHGNGFWAVLEEVASSLFSDRNASIISNSASALLDSKLLETPGKNLEISELIKALKKNSLLVTEWNPFSLEMSNGVNALNTIVSEKEFSKILIRNVQNTVRGIAIDDSINQTITAVFKLLKGIVDLRLQEILESPFTLSIKPDVWIKACEEIEKNVDQQLWKLTRPGFEFSSLHESLKEIISTGKFISSSIPAIRISAVIYEGELTWDPIVSVIEERMKTTTEASYAEVGQLLRCLLLLKKLGNETVNVSLSRLSNEGYLLHWLNQSNENREDDCFILCLVIYLQNFPDAKAAEQKIGNSNAGFNILTSLLSEDNIDLAKRIVEALQAEKSIDLLFKIIDETETDHPLILRCLRIVAESSFAEELFKANEFIDRWPLLPDMLNEESSKERYINLIKRLAISTSLIDDIMKAGFNIDDSELYITIASCTNFNSTFLDWCRSSLESLADSVWIDELMKEKDGLKLLVMLLEQNVHMTVTTALQDALFDHAKKVIADEVALSTPTMENWKKILESLSSESRKILKARIRDEAMKMEGKCSNQFFEIYADELNDLDILIENGDIVEKLFSPLVREKSIGGLRWLKNVFTSHPAVLNKLSDKIAVREFKERITQEISGESIEEESWKLVKEIANLIKLNPVKKTSADEEDTNQSDNKV